MTHLRAARRFGQARDAGSAPPASRATGETHHRVRYDSPAMDWLRRPLTEQQRASLPILVVVRWLLLGAVLFVINFRAGTDAGEQIALNFVVLGNALLNVRLHWLMWNGRRILVALPLVASLYDITGITAGIALVDGFDNPNFLLYFPALLAFTLVFPGWWSVLYATGALAAYTPISIFTHSAFDGGDKADLKDLFLRLIAMASTLLIANMIVRIERHRRERAVAAERASGLERERVSEEIHDGVAQNVYLLAMNLEMLAEAERDPDRAERVSSMVRLAKETLIETRGLLTNLQPVMAGTKGLPDLVRTQAEEFAAVTRIPRPRQHRRPPRDLPPESIGDIYRVVQEGLANVYKHARATEATIALNYRPHDLLIEVRDNGRGLDLVDDGHRGHGIHNMRQRAARLGGGIVFETLDGGGTRLAMTVPLGKS